MPMQKTVYLVDEAATLAFAAECARHIRAPAVVYLNGGLGAGKTTFARGFLQALGHRGAVKSPTYAILESYMLPEIRVHHFDLYRFASPQEWEEAGLDDLPAPAVCLIEWPQQGADFVPPPDWALTFQEENGGRRCTVSAISAAAQKGWGAWQN